MEMHDLEFSGNGLIQDPETGARERVEFWGPLSAAKIKLNPEEYLDPKNNNMYPKFSIVDVIMDPIEADIVVSVFGELPLYKTHEFEAKIKKRLVSLI